MSGPGSGRVKGHEGREAADAPQPAISLAEDLAAHLEARRAELLEELQEELWEPLRRSADRMGSLRDEALAAEDSLRDAGRAVRLLCDELERHDPSGALRSGLAVHLDELADFAHLVPRVMESGGEGDASGRLLPARDAVRAVLEAGYPDILRSLLEPEVLILAPARALPPSPADLLRPEDYAGTMSEAVDRAERHLGRVLERAARKAVEEVRSLLRGSRPLDRLRLRWRRIRVGARRDAAESALDELLDDADASFGALLEARRFTADLARRERALTEAADEAAAQLEESASCAEALRALAARIEEAGRSAAPSGETRRDRPPEAVRLEQLETRILGAVERVRGRLPETDRPDADLTRALGRFVQLSEALSGVGEEGRGRRSPAVREPAAIRDRVSRVVPRVRDATREVRGIVSHALQAARSEAVVREPDPAVVAGLVSESCERAALRLREGADLLERALEEAAHEVREAPDRILAELRARPGRGEEGGGGGLDQLRELGHRLGRLLPRLRDRLRAARGAAPGAVATPSAEEARPSGAEEGFESLPVLYRWLFRPEPVDDPQLLKGRRREVARLRDLRRRWERGEPAAMAVVGRPGAGKTSLLNCGAAELEAGMPVHRGRVDRRLSGAREAVEWLARFFGVEADLGEPADLAEALQDHQGVVLLENAERLYRREVGGYQAIRAVGELIGATEGRLAWVVTFDREPWRVLGEVTGVAGRFAEVLELAPLTREKLEEAILARHRLTGYDLRFAGEGDPGRRREQWFDRLRRRSDGIPGRALQLWRDSLVAAGSHAVRVLPLRPQDPGRAQGLARSDLFVLAALVQHGDLRETELPGLLHTPPDEVAERLAALRREGLIGPVPGLPPPAPLHVDRGVYGEVERRLREAGLLVPEERDS